MQGDRKNIWRSAPMPHRLIVVVQSRSSAPTPHRLIVVVQSPLLYRVVGRNGEAIFLRGPTIRSPPIFVFSFSRPLTGRNWGCSFSHLLRAVATAIPKPIASYTLRRHRKHPRSSPGPKPRSGRPFTLFKFPCCVQLTQHRC